MSSRIDDVFELRFEALFASAYRVAFRILGERTEAQDVAGEALTRAYARWARIIEDPEPWVVRVASNCALDVVRRRKTAWEHLSQLTPDSSDLQIADRRVDLQRGLLELPRRQREVVVLRYLADQSEETVARALGISVGTVKSHAARGLAALRRTLGDEGGSDV